jgi:hypothetical protein
MAERSIDQRRGLGLYFGLKKIIVVGGSAGIGRQVAVTIVRHGGSVV